MKSVLRSAFGVASFFVAMGGLHAQSIIAAGNQAPSGDPAAVAVSHSVTLRPAVLRPSILRQNQQPTLRLAANTTNSPDPTTLIYILICIPTVLRGGFPTIQDCVTCFEQDCIG